MILVIAIIGCAYNKRTCLSGVNCINSRVSSTRHDEEVMADVVDNVQVTAKNEPEDDGEILPVVHQGSAENNDRCINNAQLMDTLSAEIQNKV